MKYLVLKELPQGQQPGDVLETTEAMGDVLELVGAVKKADDEADPEPTKRRYHRRDLTAEA